MSGTHSALVGLGHNHAGEPIHLPWDKHNAPLLFFYVENVHFDWFNQYLCTGEHLQSDLDIFQFDFMFPKPHDLPQLLCANVQTEMRFGVEQLLFPESRHCKYELFYGRIMPWQSPSIHLSVRPSISPRFPDFFSTCFEISIWNLVYTFSRWHNMSSLNFITIGSLWPSLQPKVCQTQFLQSWPYKSR